MSGFQSTAHHFAKAITKVVIVIQLLPGVVFNFQENFLTSVDAEELMLTKSDMSNGTLFRAIRYYSVNCAYVTQFFCTLALIFISRKVHVS